MSYAVRRIDTSEESGKLPIVATILEYSCLFTHDLKRKTKRWQDGKVKYHTWNQKAMVYDDHDHTVGDAHLPGAADLADTDTFELDRGSAIVEVQECTGTREQDLSELIDRRSKEVEDRRTKAAAKRLSSTAPPSKHDFRPPTSRIHRPLATIVSPGTPGRAVVPDESPYEARQIELGSSGAREPPPKRAKRDISPPSRTPHSRALFGTTISLTGGSQMVPSSGQTRPLHDRTNVGVSERGGAVTRARVDGDVTASSRTGDAQEVQGAEMCPRPAAVDELVVSPRLAREEVIARKGNEGMLSVSSRPSKKPRDESNRRNSHIGSNGHRDPYMESSSSSASRRGQPNRATETPDVVEGNDSMHDLHEDSPPRPVGERSPGHPRTYHDGHRGSLPGQRSPTIYSEKTQDSPKNAGNPNRRSKKRSTPDEGFQKIDSIKTISSARSAHLRDASEHSGEPAAVPDSSDPKSASPAGKMKTLGQKSDRKCERPQQTDPGDLIVSGRQSRMDQRNVSGQRHSADRSALPSEPTTVGREQQSGGQRRAELRIRGRKKRGLLMLSEKKTTTHDSTTKERPLQLLHSREPSGEDESPTLEPPSDGNQNDKERPPADDAEERPLQRASKRIKPQKRKASTPVLNEDLAVSPRATSPLAAPAKGRLGQQQQLTTATDSEEELPRRKRRKAEEQRQPQSDDDATMEIPGPRIARMARKSVKSREVFGFAMGGHGDLVPGPFASGTRRLGPAGLDEAKPEVRPALEEERQEPSTTRDAATHEVVVVQEIDDAATDAPSMQDTLPQRLVNPATRGKKAARKEDAAGSVLQAIVPFDAIANSRPQLKQPTLSEQSAEAPEQTAAPLPGFSNARNGPWSAHAQDLLGIGRPERRKH